MTDVTVKQLADSVGTPVDRLLGHMKEAGLTHNKEDEIVSEEQKKILLEFLTKKIHVLYTDPTASAFLDICSIVEISFWLMLVC